MSRVGEMLDATLKELLQRWGQRFRLPARSVADAQVGLQPPGRDRRSAVEGVGEGELPAAPAIGATSDSREDATAEDLVEDDVHILMETAPYPGTKLCHTVPDRADQRQVRNHTQTFNPRADASSVTPYHGFNARRATVGRQDGEL